MELGRKKRWVIALENVSSLLEEANFNYWTLRGYTMY